jgi:hypothetical protein
VGALACSRPPSPPSPSDAAPEDTVIGFDQRGCYGPCPAFNITLRGDGVLDYDGKMFVAARGRRSGHVSPSAVADLVRNFDEVGFETLTWRKNCPEKYTTDHGTVQLTFRRGGRSHTLEHDLGDVCAPMELRHLEEHVSAVIEPAIHDLVQCEAGTCPP